MGQRRASVLALLLKPSRTKAANRATKTLSQSMTLEPDGTATGCNPVEVGSTPTSVSDRSTAGSDYIT